MANVRISGRANADLTEILATSLERWGEDGRARYRSLLATVMRELGADPEHLMSKDCRDLAPGLRSFHVRHVDRDHGVKAPVHVIYYRKARSSIVIVRVLGVLRDAHDRERRALRRKQVRAQPREP